MREIRQTHVIPAGVRGAAAVAGLEGVDGAGEVSPGEVLHYHGGVVGSWGAAIAGGLVGVGLRHEDGEGRVVDADVGPGNVFGKALCA